VTQLTIPDPLALQGQTLLDGSGEGIGTIEGIYLDNVTRTPEWAAVRLDRQALALVPLAEASLAGGGLQVGYARSTVLSAPNRLRGLDSEVTEATEEQLHRYYAGGGRSGAGGGAASGGGDSSPGAVAEAAGVAKEVAADLQEQVAGVAGTVADEAAGVASEAKAQVVDVVAGAKEQAVAVVDSAREQAVEVAEQATAEARELYETTRTELQGQAETQLEQFAETLHRLAGQALALARGNAEQAGQVGDLVGRAGHELQTAARDIRNRGSSGMLESAQRAVKQRPRVAIIGTAAAVVAGARLMGTPAGERLKERLAPLKEQAIEAGREAAEELAPRARQHVESVRAEATRAAVEVKKEAEGAVREVRGTVTQAGRTVKGTTKRSASDVKGTAKRSASDVKRSARNALPAV